MLIELRAARPADYDFAKRLEHTEMRWIIERMFGWNQAAQDKKFAVQFAVDAARIIVVDAVDVGWLQTIEEHDAVFLEQFYIESRFQRRQIGTAVLRMVFDEAASKNKAVWLTVLKLNPARALYERLGFRTTHEDEYKFYMRRDA